MKTNQPQNILFIELKTNEPYLANQFKSINETVSINNSYDVIIDFSKIEIINSTNISNILILQSLLEESGHKLILLNVSTITRCIFNVAGLNRTLCYADSYDNALKLLESDKKEGDII